MAFDEHHKLEPRYYLSEIDKDPSSIFCYHFEVNEPYVVDHQHEKGQFLYCEGGIVYVTIGKETYYLPARHYIWIPPKAIHSIYPNSSDIIMRNLYFPIQEHDDKNYFHQVGIYPANNFLIEFILYSKRWVGDITPKDRTTFVIASAFKELLPKLSRNSLKLSLPYPNDDRLRKVIAYLNDKMDSSITMNKVSTEFGFSERSLSRLFQKDVKLTFVQYYTVLRMLRALELLIEDKYSISEVANMVGYSSLPTFSNTFQKVVGVRPTDYAKKKDIL